MKCNKFCAERRSIWAQDVVRCCRNQRIVRRWKLISLTFWLFAWNGEWNFTLSKQHSPIVSNCCMHIIIIVELAADEWRVPKCVRKLSQFWRLKKFSGFTRNICIAFLLRARAYLMREIMALERSNRTKRPIRRIISSSAAVPFNDHNPATKC